MIRREFAPGNCESDWKMKHGNHQSGHMPQLDGLRGLAVIAVVFSHYGSETFANLFDPGDFGVRLFFVLSGFLITGLLLDARVKAAQSGYPMGGVLRAFYVRRFLRIFPLYYFVLLACFLIGIPCARQFFVWHVTYTTNVLMSVSNSYLSGLGHFWSLAVEEQFYLLWPAVILFVPMRWLTSILVAVILIGPTSRGVFAVATGHLLPSTMLMPQCLDALGIGALFAHLHRREQWSPLRRQRLARGALIPGMVLYMTWMALRGWQPAWTARVIMKDLSYALIFCYVVSGAADGFGGWAKRVLEWRPLVYIGTISYGIYVYHDVLRLADRQMFHSLLWSHLSPDGTGAVPFLGVLGAAIIVASFSWHVFEKPLNDLKSRFPYVVTTASRERRATPSAPIEPACAVGA